MYQQITKRYVPLRCDCTVSGFYQTDEIQAYPSRSWDCSKMLVQHREEGGSARRVIDSGLPKASCLPNGVFLGHSGSFDYAVGKPARSPLLGGDIRAEECAFIGLALREKKSLQGLSHATARLRLPLMLGLAT